MLRYYFISIHVNITFNILASIIVYNEANVDFKTPAFFSNQLPLVLKQPMSNIHTKYLSIKQRKYTISFFVLI